MLSWRFQSNPEKHGSVCSDSQAALKAIQTLRPSPLVQASQEALHGISTRHAVRLYWVLGRVGVRRNEMADELAKDVSFLKIVGPELTLGISRPNIRRRVRRWLVNQDL
jgi:hypothetical protein